MNPTGTTALILSVAAMLCVGSPSSAPHAVAQTPAPPTATPPAAAENPELPADTAAAPLDGEEGRELSVRLFTPRSQLIVPRSDIRRARFPVVDVHTHFYYKLRHNQQALDDYLAAMDRNGIQICVSLDGRLGDQLDSHINFLWREHRNRFVIFANIDWQGEGRAEDPASWACQRPGFAARTAEQLAAAVAQGVSGLKVFKQLGLGYRDADGSLLRIDDPRWDPIWAACGQLGIPVLIHSGDPAAFFEPVDRYNERWEELSRHPDWSFHGPQFPSLQEVLAARNRVVARHPQTQFIGAHLASSEHDLATAAQWLDQFPNLHLDIASRINELGRQPTTARKFLTRYADRVLLGTDGPWPELRLHLYWRFLETADDAFDYSEKSPPPQGLWQIHGLELPEDVLRKIYYLNAAKLIPGVQERLAALGVSHEHD